MSTIPTLRTVLLLTGLVLCGRGASEGASPSIPGTPAPGSCNFSAGWSAPARLQHYQFDPIVVNPKIADAVALKVVVPPSIDSVVLELAAGGTVTLASRGSNRFCAMLTSEQVLFGYQPDDAQHNFVGFLNLNAGPTRLKRLNLFIDVADDAVPIVRPERIQPDMQATAHVVNIVTSSLPERVGVQQSAQRFYTAYADEYDFLNVVSTPAFTGNRQHAPIRNDVSGIGLALFDGSASYGSAGSTAARTQKLFRPRFARDEPGRSPPGRRGRVRLGRDVAEDDGARADRAARSSSSLAVHSASCGSREPRSISRIRPAWSVGE